MTREFTHARLMLPSSLHAACPFLRQHSGQPARPQERQHAAQQAGCQAREGPALPVAHCWLHAPISELYHCCPKRWGCIAYINNTYMCGSRASEIFFEFFDAMSGVFCCFFGFVCCWVLGFFKSSAANSRSLLRICTAFESCGTLLWTTNALLPSHTLNATWFFATYPSTSVNPIILFAVLPCTLPHVCLSL